MEPQVVILFIPNYIVHKLGRRIRQNCVNPRKFSKKLFVQVSMEKYESNVFDKES